MISRAATALARLLPAETAHRMAVWGMAHGLTPRRGHRQQLTRLDQTLMGLQFPNPLGLAAGFDKNAEAIKGAFQLGFGFTEVGTITPLPQAGNAKPRVFRLVADAAVINRYGFNNQGAEAAVKRLQQYRQTKMPWHGPLGVNIGANKDSTDRVADYHKATAMLSPLADYVTVNVSSPNTPGLRDMQAPQILADIMSAVRTGLDRPDLPVLIKLAPDMAEEDFFAVLDRLPDFGVAGVILTNTTISRPDSLSSPHKAESGGLSGLPLLEASTRWLSLAHRRLGGEVMLIGVGGIDSAEAAYAKILAGANLVQLYTALALQGPDLPSQIITGLDQLLARDGFSHVSDAVGQAKDAAEALATSGWTSRLARSAALKG